MIKLKQLLLELDILDQGFLRGNPVKLKKVNIIETKGNKYIVYHGTGEKFTKFDLKKATQGIIWFTSNKQEIISGEVGAQGKGYIITAEVTINNPAGWDEYDKLGLGQLESAGYDGVILKNNDTDYNCFVFSPKQVKIINIEKMND